MTGLDIRPGRDADAAGFIALIGGCWREFPGLILDVDGELPELRALAAHYARKGGALWVAEQGGAVAGMVAAAPLDDDGAWEIGRMYVAKPLRGTGLAQRLLDGAAAHAVGQGAHSLVLWTDTRFDAAHRFYEKASFVRSGAIRILDDISRSLEFRYAKPLGPLAIEALDAAAAASAERRLSGILLACAEVADPAPLSPDRARAFWRGVSSSVATGGTLLLAAWSQGALVGTVQLRLDTPADQRHRAELCQLLVHPAARRRGVARALVQGAEQAAGRSGRRLLTLDTRAGNAAAPLFHALGWTETGRIPGYMLAPDGTPQDALFFWKAV